MFKLVHKCFLILWSIAWLILPSLSFSNFAGLISQTAEFFKKFALWSLKVMKQVFFLLMPIWSNICMCTFSIICFPWMLIVFLLWLFAFLHIDVIMLFHSITYSSLGKLLTVLVNHYFLMKRTHEWKNRKAYLTSQWEPTAVQKYGN